VEGGKPFAEECTSKGRQKLRAGEDVRATRSDYEPNYSDCG